MLNGLFEKLFPLNFALLHLKLCSEVCPASLISWELQVSSYSQWNTFQEVFGVIESQTIGLGILPSFHEPFPSLVCRGSSQPLSFWLWFSVMAASSAEHLHLFASLVSSSLLVFFTSFKYCCFPLELCIYFCKSFWTQSVYKMLDKIRPYCIKFGLTLHPQLVVIEKLKHYQVDWDTAWIKSCDFIQTLFFFFFL